MGNNPSKHKSKKDDSQFQSYPSFSRTDTQGSSRSIRSIRSKISSISQNSDPAMGFKSAQQETFSPTNQSFPTNIPSHSSGNSLSNGSNLSVNNKGVPGNSFLASPSMGSHMNNHMGTSLGAMPISPNGFNIPASMQQIQPKEPILIRRDGEGNITPRTFGTLNDNEDTDGGVDYFGFLPDNYDAEDNNGDIRSKANSKNNDSYNVERDDDDNDNNNGEDNDIFNNDEFDDDNNIITRSTNHDLTDNLGNLSLKEPTIIVTDDSNGHTPITHQRKDSFPINSPPIAQSHSRTPSGSSFHTPISPNFPRVFGSGSLPSPIDTTHKGDLNEISNNNTVISPNNYESSTPLSSSFNQSTGFGGSLGVNGADMPTLTNVISSETTTKKGKTPVVLTPQSLEEMIQRLLDAGYSGKTTKNVCLKNSEIASICRTAREILLSQPMLLELSPPVKVVGDVHGQFGDVIRMFDLCGFPPASNYLFLGDYVDRGKQSLETILLLLCYKIKYPENFFLLRGNHECANVTRVYGFYDECKRRCNIKTWKIFIDTFNTLPIAAIVAQKIFCVHGGLSPTLGNMNEIRSIQRPTDVPDYGLLNDLLWSDPADTNNEWEDNERGVSYCFNKVSINKFLAKFGFDLVCRAHMVVEDGYEFFNDRSLVTVFSAPNYCGEFDNWGAVMSVSEELLCSFELLKPLDSVALRQVMKRGKYERRASMKSLQREREQALLGLNTNADTSSNSLVVNSMNTGTGPA